MKRTSLLTAVLALGSFAAVVSAFILPPLLTDIGAEFGVSDSIVGQLAALQALVSACVALLAAPVLDRYPRRAALRFECGVLFVATLMTALAPSFGWLLAARAVAGIGGAMIIGICLATIGDIFTDPGERNRKVSMLLSAASLAGIIGMPFVAQVNDVAGWRWAAGVTAILPLLVVVGTIWMPAKATSSSSAPFWTEYRERVSQVAASRQTTWLLGVFVVMLASWCGFEVYVAAYLESTFGAGANAVSVMFALAGISFLVGTNLTPRLIERWPKRTLHAVLMTVLMLNFLAVGVIYVSLPAAMVFVVILAVVMACVFTITSILMIESLPEARGAVMALQSAANQAGAAIGAAWSGVALATLGSYSASFRSLALLMPLGALCLLMSTRALRRAAAPAIPVESIVAEPAM